MINSTIEKFGYPATLLKEYRHWVVLIRPAQVTLGSLVLAAKSPATAYGQLPSEAFVEQALVARDIEHALKNFCGYEKINYLMLMMVDPHVHFHVIPRYEGVRKWGGMELPDAGWPALPDLRSATVLSTDQIEALRAEIAESFTG